MKAGHALVQFEYYVRRYFLSFWAIFARVSVGMYDFSKSARLKCFKNRNTHDVVTNVWISGLSVM